MDAEQEVHLHIRGAALPTQRSAPPSSMLEQLTWWFVVALNIFFLIAGQTAATLLGRLYYDEGGNSKWLATVVQTAAFPILFLPLFFIPSSPSTSYAYSPHHNIRIVLIYIALGLIIVGDNLMYSYGLLNLPVSTFSLICATQLAFNAIFSYFLNAQKFTPFIFNSIVLLTFSAALLGVNSEGATELSKGKYALGFILTLGASCSYSLILSLMQLTFQKVQKRETFSVVLEMQLWTAFVATCASVVGLFCSGEWKGLKEEMEGFGKGRVSYVLTLVGTAVSWQVASVGVVGLIFLVSSLFSNVISTFALPVVPIFAVIFFKDKMGGVKVMAILIALWGFASYIYQNYLDEIKAKKTVNALERDVKEASSTPVSG